MEDKQYQEVIGRLEKITKLLSIIALKDREKEQDKIELLDMMGFRPIEIARLLHKSPQNISTGLGNLRKKKGTSSEQTAAETSSQQEMTQDQTTLSKETTKAV